MVRWSDRTRAAALVPIGALAVHQLRYWLAYGPAASRELLDTGHSYLHSLTPWIVLAVGIAVGSFLARLARTRGSGEVDERGGRGLLALWMIAAGSLLAIYVGQEVLEGLLEAGHPAGLIGVLGDGGWWAIPAAVAIGGALALLIRGGRAAIALVARLGCAPTRPARRALPAWSRPAAASFIRLTPLATAAAGRAPPQTVA